MCNIQKAPELGQSTASQHLKILETAGLITYKKEGSRVNYRQEDGARNPYGANLSGNVRYWLEDDADETMLVASLPEVTRDAICAG